MTVIRPLIPRLVPARLAYDFDYFASRLADPSLLNDAVAVCVHRAPLLAVPVGGVRRGGFTSFDLLILAEKTRGLLQGLPGFPDVRVRPSPYRDTSHVVEWGAQPPVCDYDDAARSQFYGYREAAIRRFTTDRPGKLVWAKLPLGSPEQWRPPSIAVSRPAPLPNRRPFIGAAPRTPLRSREPCNAHPLYLPLLGTAGEGHPRVTGADPCSFGAHSSDRTGLEFLPRQRHHINGEKPHMPDPTPTPDPLKAGEEAAADLADALNTIGIVLPSLRGDWPALNGAPMVQLGGAPPQTVHQLAAWIRQRPTPEPVHTPQPSEVIAS